jgi:hypothetical protein
MITGDLPRKWFDWIPWVEFSYNTFVHSSIKITPFEVMCGVPSSSLLTYVLETSNVQAVDEHLCDQDSIIHELRRNLLIA